MGTGSVRLALVAVAAMVGCGGGGGGGVQCGDGTELVDGVCLAVGCGDGTVPDQDGKCVPATLPSDRRACSGRFGPIPENASGTVYVDAAATGSADGSSDHPYPTIGEGVNAAAPGQVVAVATGTYTEAVVITKSLQLEGRCARDVIVDGGIAVAETTDVGVRGMTVTGGTPGVDVSATTKVELRYLRIEANTGAGARIDGSQVDVLDSEVRMTELASNTDDITLVGDGVSVTNGSDIHVENSVIDMNVHGGVSVSDLAGPVGSPTPTPGSAGVIDMNLITGNDAFGVVVHEPVAGRVEVPPPGDPLISISSCTITDNGADGVLAVASNLELVGSQLSGNGAAVADALGTNVSSTHARVAIAANTIRGGDLAAAWINASEGTVAANRILDGTRGLYVPDGAVSIVNNTVSGNLGNGIVVDRGQSVIDMNLITGNGGGRASAVLVTSADSVQMRDNTVTGNHHGGIHIMGAGTVEVLDNEISDTALADGAVPETSGHGIYIESSDKVDIGRNFVHDNAGAGISVSQISTGVTPFVIDMNIVATNGFTGINVQNSGPGDLLSNGIDGNVAYGIRVQGSMNTTAIAMTANTTAHSSVSTAGDDGDGIAVIGSRVEVTSNSGIDMNGRAGILAGAGAAGVIDMNFTQTNSTYDILVQESPAMALGSNTTSIAPIVSATALENLNVVETTLVEQ